MEIKINEDFSLNSDPNQWILIEYRDGVNKKNGEATRTPYPCYPGTLMQACMKIVDHSAMKCQTAEDIILAILVAKEDIQTAISKHTEKMERLGI